MAQGITINPRAVAAISSLALVSMWMLFSGSSEPETIAVDAHSKYISWTGQKELIDFVYREKDDPCGLFTAQAMTDEQLEHLGARPLRL